MAFGRYDFFLGHFQRIGQLEHIITEHVDIGLCIREASRESGEHYHPRTGFLGQQIRDLLTQLDFRDHDLNPFIFDLRDEAVKLESV
jgi:hypothetical protein